MYKINEIRIKLLSVFLIILVFTTVSAIQQKCVFIAQYSGQGLNSTCPQNSFCSSNGYCVCDANFFGNCQNDGHLLTKDKQSFNLTQKMTYFIIKPTVDIYVYYQFTLCNPQKNSNQQVLNLWYDDGTLQTPTQSNSLGVDKTVKITQECIALMTPFFKFGNQKNGEAQILILGMRLQSSGNYTIQLSVAEEQIFGFQIILKIIIILICAIFISCILGIVYCIYKCRRRHLAGNLNEEKNDLAFFKELMPQTKVKNGQFKDQLCSVCLGDLLQNQQIRKTVCDHVFHKICLDQWCQTNLSCPICRYPLDKENIIYRKSQKQSSQLNNSTINDTIIVQQDLIYEQFEMDIKKKMLQNQQE